MQPVVRQSEYSKMLTDPRWQRKRLEVLEWCNWSCQCCYSKTKPLHVHHLRYRHGASPWEYEIWEMVSVCDDCHTELHRRKSAGEEGFAYDAITARMQWLDMDLPDLAWHQMVWETRPHNWRDLRQSNTVLSGKG